jgi:hypothetical protein
MPVGLAKAPVAVRRIEETAKIDRVAHFRESFIVILEKVKSEISVPISQSLFPQSKKSKSTDSIYI